MTDDTLHPSADKLRPLYIAQLDVRLAVFKPIAARLERGTARLVDSETLEQEAHKLRGSAGCYGMPALSLAAERLETAVRSGEHDASEIGALLTGVIAEMERAIEEDRGAQDKPQHHTLDDLSTVRSCDGFRPRILVIDDDEDSRDLVGRAMAKFADVQSVSTGMAALDALRASRFDIVLLDFNLPDLTGLEVLLRARQYLDKAQTSVVMVTAVCDAKQVSQLLSAGARDYLVKPYKPSVLIDRVAAIMKRQSPIALIADDDPVVREVLRDRLRHFGVKVLVASNCGEALEIARKVRPHLVILDRQMARQDGLEVLVALRKEPATASISVVVLSAMRLESDISDAYLCGADDYIVKPFLPDDVTDRCMFYLHPIEARVA